MEGRGEGRKEGRKGVPCSTHTYWLSRIMTTSLSKLKMRSKFGDLGGTYMYFPQTYPKYLAFGNYFADHEIIFSRSKTTGEKSKPELQSKQQCILVKPVNNCSFMILLQRVDLFQLSMTTDNKFSALKTYPSLDIPIITNINANTSSNECPEQDGTDNYAFPFKYVT